jgi:hypothetical protein
MPFGSSDASTQPITAQPPQLGRCVSFQLRLPEFISASASRDRMTWFPVAFYAAAIFAIIVVAVRSY